MDVDVSAMGDDSRRSLDCGIDPGREKFGIAFCDGDELVLSALLPTTELGAAASWIASGELAKFAPFAREGEPPREAIIRSISLGDGTGHEPFAAQLEAAGVRSDIVDERGTTLEARALYWRLHRPRLLWRLIPTSLRVPPRPIDDLAAWAIARRARARR